MLHKCRLVVSEIENDIRVGPRTAHEHIPPRWHLEGLRSISNRSADRSGHACVAHSGAAGPSHRDIAGFSQFKETTKSFVPCDSEPAARKRHWRAGTRPALWVGGGMVAPPHPRGDNLPTPEKFPLCIPSGPPPPSHAPPRGLRG